MNIFDHIRNRVSLEEIASRSTNLKRSGARLVGCCPIHKESTPSFSVYSDGHYRCYGCGSSGDVIDLWGNVQGVRQGIESALDLARAYGIQLPDRDPEEVKKAEERRAKEADYHRQAQACHQALVNNPSVIGWWKGRGFNEELQKRFLLGSNRNGSSAVIPFWHRGRIQGLIRRQLYGMPKYLNPSADDFPSGYKPLLTIFSGGLNWHIAEGIIDALALAALGFNAIAIAGASISENQLAEFQTLSGKFYLFPDNDEGGVQAGPIWARILYPRARLCPFEYGENCKDAAALFAAQGEESKSVIESLKERSQDALDLALAEAPRDSARTAYAYAKEQVIPLVAKLEDEGERDAALEDGAKALGLKITQLRKTLRENIKHDSKNDEIQQSDKPQPGTPRHEAAMAFLKERDLLERSAMDMERLGHVGEYRTKKLAFICALSARAGRAIQPSTHAQSASGKNALWDAVLSLFPPEMIIRRSGLSAKALFRTKVNLKGAILYIQEVAGSESSDYTIRVLQSDGRLEYEATEKMPDGSMKNVVYTTEGPTVIVQTTTRNHLHPENETRVFPIYIDESEEQTRRIIESALKEAAGDGIKEEERGKILRKWRDAIQLLEPGEVIIPFAQQIEMPSSSVRIRRDVRRLLDVIRVITWLHQYQREKDSEGRIIATEVDFHSALELVSDSLARAWKTLTPAEQKTLEAIQSLPEEKQTEGFKRRDLKISGVSERRLKEILRSLSETGYLDCDGRTGPQGYTFTVARDPENVSLGISLVSSPDSKQPDERKGYRLGESSSPDNAQSPEVADYQALGANGRNGNCPINVPAFQQIDSIGRTNGRNVSEPEY